MLLPRHPNFLLLIVVLLIFSSCCSRSLVRCFTLSYVHKKFVVCKHINEINICGCALSCLKHYILITFSLSFLLCFKRYVCLCKLVVWMDEFFDIKNLKFFKKIYQKNLIFFKKKSKLFTNFFEFISSYLPLSHVYNKFFSSYF